MPDPALSAALREAYASAPVADVIYHTLELHHAAFDLPIRVVRDYAPLDARLEATAPFDAGNVVTFVDYPFDLTLPEQDASTVTEARITIDNVDREILAQLILATGSATPISVIYRAFISGRTDTGPENDPPITLTLKSITATPFRISATAGFTSLQNRKYPSEDYTLERFPALTT